MKIIRGLSTNKSQPVTDPFPSKNGVYLEFRGGDFCHPRGKGDWFNPPYFDKVTRFYLRWPVLPFISWRFGKHGGYVGAKIWGMDSPAYKKWPAMKGMEHEVYAGSQAIMFSIRPHANLE